MGVACRASAAGCAADDKTRRNRSNRGSFNQNRANLETGARTRFKPKHPRPSVGDRFGEITVARIDEGPAGGLAAVWVVCSCGEGPYQVHISNLRAGKSTRCDKCAKRANGRWRKDYFAYADIVSDAAHRRRLLNRISACYGRCSNPRDAGWENYGGRGIKVFWPKGRDGRRAFLKYLTTLEGWDNPILELDRIDVDVGYAPGNLRFITKQANRNNQRTVRRLQRRIAELEARLRHCSCGTAESVHGGDE